MTKSDSKRKQVIAIPQAIPIMKTLLWFETYRCFGEIDSVPQHAGNFENELKVKQAADHNKYRE